MGKYRPAEATVLSCSRQDAIVNTTIEIEPFDNKKVLLNYPRAPASLILRDEGKVTWHFELHKAISIEEKKISFMSYTISGELPVLGHRYVFQCWWRPDQLEIAQSNPADWERKVFIPPNPKWDHEHCTICWERLSEYDDEKHFGYVRINDRNQEDWICEKCYNEYIVSGFGKKLGDDIEE
jgi:hypothetical protein